MSTPQSWSGGGRRQADEVGWTRKVTEMGWGTDKGRKRQEREEGRLYHDRSLPLFHFSCLNHFSPVLCPISSSCKHLSCFSLHGLGPKGGIGVLAYIWPTTFSTSAPIHHHGDTFHFHLLICAA